MKKLSAETQNLYAELLQQLLAMHARRSIGQLKGCFTSKTVKGETYCYFQHIDLNGKQQQLYIGRKTDSLEKLMARFETEKELFQPDAEQIKRLCAQLRAGGTMCAEAATVRVVKALADSGIFNLNGVLVGTHAFAVIGNMLGVNWETNVKTQDIDIGSRRNVDIALPAITTDLPGTLEKLAMGFLPVPGLNPKNPSTSFKVRGQTMMLDVLTPSVKSTETAPVFIAKLNTAAQPLPFLDYVLENYEKGVMLNGDGILVNVPNPARFAFHKLIVSQNRSAALHVKAGKDISQAASLFEILCEERPGDVLLAWDNIQTRGKNWIANAKKGIAAMKRLFPVTEEKLANLIKLR